MTIKTTSSLGRLRCFAAMCLALLLLQAVDGRRGGAFLSTTGSFILSNGGDNAGANGR